MRNLPLGPIDAEVVEFIEALDRAMVIVAMESYLVLRDRGSLEQTYPGFLPPRGYEVLSVDGTERFRGRRLLTIAFHQTKSSIIKRNRFDDRTDQKLKKTIASLGFQILPVGNKVATAKWEGKRGIRESSFFARNPELAREIKEAANYKCQACGLSGPMKYGDDGKSCIEAHHLDQFADRSKKVQIEGKLTVLSDLASLCSNCHRVIHTQRPALTLNQLKTKIATQASDRDGA